MLCSDCNKNPAILFYKKIENGQEKLEGYCYECAKKHGINPVETLSQQNKILSNNTVNINDMTEQFENIFRDLAENINLDDLENMEGAITFNNIPTGDGNDGVDGPRISGTAIPLGSLFTNLFNGQNNTQSEAQGEPSGARKKVK